MRPPLLIIIALLAAAAGRAGELADFKGDDGRGRTVEGVVAGKPAVVLITTPRLADVGHQLRYLRFVQSELGEAVTCAAVVYGAEAATIAKFREGMPFAVIAGKGEPPAGTFAGEPPGPLVLLVDKKGDVVSRLAEIPDPVAAAEKLAVSFDAGPAGPPRVGERLAPLMLAAATGPPLDIATFTQGAPKTILFVTDVGDERRRDSLIDLQRINDDLAGRASTAAVFLGATTPVLKKLVDADKLEIPVLLGGALAAHRLVGNLRPPVLIETDAAGRVVGVREKAAVPAVTDLLAEEEGPAAEGEPVELIVSQIQQLTSGLKTDRVPRPSFDASGEFVIYDGHYREGDVDSLFEVRRWGGPPRRISYAGAPDAAPTCSPDGIHIAFVSARSGANEIWVCERVRGEFTQITKSGGLYYYPAYSPDGQRLAAVKKITTGENSNADLYIFTSRGRRERPVAVTFDDECDPAFGADGQTLFYAGNRAGNWDIYSCDLNGGRRRRLTGPETEDRMPAPSPDGKYVVYASRRQGEPFKLWIMNADGSAAAPLTTGPGDDLYPSFSRDGGALVFASDRSGSFEIYKLTFAPTPDYEQPRPARTIARRAHD